MTFTFHNTYARELFITSLRVGGIAYNVTGLTVTTRGDLPLDYYPKSHLLHSNESNGWTSADEVSA